MGWVKAGNIEIFSFSDTISYMVNMIFKVILGLFNPFIVFAFTIFFVGFCAFLFQMIHNKAKQSGVLDG